MRVFWFFFAKKNRLPYLFSMPHPVHIVAAAALITNPSDEVLLILDPNRGWILPGGQVEEGESLTEAVAREVLEETGITVTIGRLAGVYTNLEPPCQLIFGFLGEYVSGSTITTAESLETIWASRDQARNLVTLPVFRDRLNDLLNFAGHPVYRAYGYREPIPYHIIEDRAI